jgi:hypothetical protein
VKRLRSRYAFVLTGTPIENRIDELHSAERNCSTALSWLCGLPTMVPLYTAT